MKKVIGMLALFALVGNVASAELLKNFKYDGKVEVNAHQIQNAFDFNKKVKDINSDVDTRVQINAGFDLNDDANAVVSVVKNNRQYGATPPATSNSEDANTVQSSLFFEQAYMNLKGVLGLDHKLGRQYYGNEGDLIIYYGPIMYPFMTQYPVSALDAWTGWYKADKWNAHALSGKIINRNAAGVADRDVTINGVAGGYDLMEEAKLGAYFYEVHQMNPIGTNDTNMDVAGVKANGKFMGFDYHAELAKNYGRKSGGATPVNYTGTGFLAKVKYGMDLAGKIEFMGEYGVGSGENKNTDKKDKLFYSVNSDYRPGAIWGLSTAGLNDGTNSGLTTWNIGAKWNPSMAEKLDLGVKYIDLKPTETKFNNVKIGYTSIGQEIDFVANWKHSESVNVRGTLAMLTPTKKYAKTVVSPTAKNDATTYAGLDFMVKF